MIQAVNFRLVMCSKHAVSDFVGHRSSKACCQAIVVLDASVPSARHAAQFAAGELAE